MGIYYQAFANSGSLTLWLDDAQKQSLTFIDNDTRTLTEVRLGTQGIETGTRGTLYFDDFESRRFSYIGTLTDPGVNDPQASNSAGWTASTYTYSASIPHAVTSVVLEGGSTNSYEYDLNGNMTCRVEGGITFKQDYNAENRISAIHNMNGNCSTGSVIESWLYAYDGDGVRVVTAHYTGITLDAMTLYYMGGAYEVTGSAVKKYYSMAGQTIMRDSDGSLKYLLTDHLGSTSAVTDQNGTLLSQQRYLPFGEVRAIPNSPVTQTDFGYTGQRNLSGTGLMDYRARFYSPALGRFLQPDSIIPNPMNPQAFNRFSYVGNNPIRFTDPTGHCRIDDDADDCFRPGFNNPPSLDEQLREFGVTVDLRMNNREKRAILEGVISLGEKIAEVRDQGESASEAFTAVFEPFEFIKTDREGCWYNYDTRNVECGDFTYADFQSDVNNVVHELGHVLSHLVGGAPDDFGLEYVPLRDVILRPDVGIDWQQNPTPPDPSGGEMFGDMLVAWVFDAWNTSERNKTRVDKARDALNVKMSEWLNR